MFGQPAHPAESANSSPSKSPSRKNGHQFRGVLGFGASSPEIQANVDSAGKPGSRVISRSPLPRSRFPDPALMASAPPCSGEPSGLSHRPDFSDPTPNMGDVTETSGGGWQIPAMRPEFPTAGNATSPHRKEKPGAAVKMGRRDAWLKFLAYEGSVQICIDAMLQGSIEPARGFLANGSQELKQALSIGQLLLSPSFSHQGGGAETSIYWDDREDIVPESRVQIKPAALPRGPPAALPHSRPRLQKYPPTAAPPAQDIERLEDVALLGNPSPCRSTGGSRAAFEGDLVFGVPFVEASVVRVVGCPFLSGYDDDGNAGGSQGQGISILMYPSGMPADECGSRTTLTPIGGIHTAESMTISPDAPRGTVLVELVKGSEQLAAGTVQVAELQRVAAQCDALVNESPALNSANFFKHLVPSSWRRRDQGSSLMWVRLIDCEGAEAGHVVVAAKVTAGETSLQGGLANRAIGGNTGHELMSPSPNETLADTEKMMLPALPHNAISPNRKRGECRIVGAPLEPPRAEHEAEVDNQAAESALALTSALMAAHGRTHTSGGYFQIKPQQVYNTLLESALAASGCGPTSSLVLQGPWSWLTSQFAERYGIREQYAMLSHLHWVVRSGVAAPTAACLETLVSELAPLVAERDTLVSAETALLSHILDRTNTLLTKCFENYYALAEDARGGGLVDGVLAIRPPGTPPALRPAAALLILMRGEQSGSEGAATWLSARLRSAARKRFQGILAAAETRRRVTGIPQDSKNEDSEASAMAYARLEELCTSIMNELRADDVIHDAGVIPDGVRLPEVTAVEYIRGVTSHLHRTLQRHPPPAPTPAAVQLVEAVGRLQSFIERHRYTEASQRLNSKEIFGDFVKEWIAGSTRALQRTLRSLDRAGCPTLTGWTDFQRGGGSNRVAPLVENMLAGVEAEMGRYRRIVSHWPMHGMALEAALVATLREVTSAASRQCGLVQTKEETVATGPQGQVPEGSPVRRRAGRVAWRWVHVGPRQQDGDQGGDDDRGGAKSFSGIPSALRRGADPHQALLLNTLRRMLAVVPQLEHALAQWCGGVAMGVPQESLAAFPPPAAGLDRISREAPDLGAHWAQLVKELRTEYYACITLCAEALAGELASSPATSVAGLLRREALTTAPASVGRHLRRVLDHTAPTLRWLSSALDGRVFVALARGLWDLAARDVLRYAEDLSETGTQGAWRGRQSSGAALKALDTFYRAELAASMGSDLHNRDLAQPQHAQRAAALLADNTVEVNMSFDVY